MDADELRKRFPKASEDFIRRNTTPTPNLDRVVAAGAPKKRIQQHQGDGMNNWERQFRGVLVTQWVHVHREVSLPLANGVRYKLDFLCVGILEEGRFQIAGFEVKGMARATGIVKLKVAAKEFPWIKFHLVTKQKKKDGGGWNVQEILP